LRELICPPCILSSSRGISDSWATSLAWKMAAFPNTFFMESLPQGRDQPEDLICDTKMFASKTTKLLPSIHTPGRQLQQIDSPGEKW